MFSLKLVFFYAFVCLFYLFDDVKWEKLHNLLWFLLYTWCVVLLRGNKWNGKWERCWIEGEFVMFYVVILWMLMILWVFYVCRVVCFKTSKMENLLEYFCSKPVLYEWVLMDKNKNNDLLNVCYVYWSYTLYGGPGKQVHLRVYKQRSVLRSVRAYC